MVHAARKRGAVAVLFWSQSSIARNRTSRLTADNEDDDADVGRIPVSKTRVPLLSPSVDARNKRAGFGFADMSSKSVDETNECVLLQLQQKKRIPHVSIHPSAKKTGCS